MIDRAALDALLADKKKVVTHVDLTEIDAQKPPIDFSGAKIDNCTLSEMNLKGLKFVKATVKHCWVNGTDFSNADFSEAKLVGGFLTKMNGASFRGATLKKTDFGQAKLEKASFENANLEGATFFAAKLDGAKFPGATLAGARFLKASLVGTDFTGAILDGVNMKDADISRAVGFKAPPRAAPGTSTIYETAGAEGGPIVVVPASIAANWKAAGQGEPEDVVKVSGWVETASTAFNGARVLLLDGELDTGFIATDDGGVLIRGGDFDSELADAKKAVARALKKKGWKPHAHDFVLKKPDVFVFSANSEGAATADAIESDFGVIHAQLEAGTYAVEVLGTDGDDGPVVFIRLARRKK